MPRSRNAARAASRFEGEDLAAAGGDSRSLRGNRMAMIFQEPMTALNPAYTIGDQLTEVHRRHKGSARRGARRGRSSCSRRSASRGAAERLRQYPHQLSGGLRQRVMIAMALMCGPTLLIADEPTTALDVTIQAQILRLLLDLQRDSASRILLITHDLGVVARVAAPRGRDVCRRDRRDGTAAELFGAPRHPYTRGLMPRSRCRARRRPASGSAPSRARAVADRRGARLRLPRPLPARDAVCAEPVAPRARPVTLAMRARDAPAEAA